MAPAISCAKSQIISDWFLHCTPKTSAVTRSQSNRKPLGRGETGDSHARAADKSAATDDVIVSTFQRKVSNSLLNQSLKALRKF